MAYMNREDRRASIVEAAIGIAMESGLSAATVRGVAAALGTASGQIHHHFSSAGELRAEAFRTLSARLREELDRRLEVLPCRERLREALTVGEGDRGAMELRFWNEAADAARADAHVRAALVESMNDWMALLVAVIDEGKATGDFRTSATSRDVAERLAALCLGLDELNRIGVLKAPLRDMGHHIEMLIDLETAPRRADEST